MKFVDMHPTYHTQFFVSAENDLEFAVVENETPEGSRSAAEPYDLRVEKTKETLKEGVVPSFVAENKLKLIAERLQFNQDNRHQRPFVAIRMDGGRLVKAYILVLDIHTAELLSVKELDLRYHEKKMLKADSFRISACTPINSIRMKDSKVSKFCQNYQVCICYEEHFRF